jgi:hypothetical protein
MHDSKEQQLASEDSSKRYGDSQNQTTSRTWKTRWRFKSLIAVVSSGVLMVVIYLLRAVLVPNYVGIGVALCFVACGLLLVRHLLRMLLDADKLQDSQLKASEASLSPTEANTSERTVRTAETERHIK